MGGGISRQRAGYEVQATTIPGTENNEQRDLTLMSKSIATINTSSTSSYPPMPKHLMQIHSLGHQFFLVTCK